MTGRKLTQVQSCFLREIPFSLRISRTGAIFTPLPPHHCCRTTGGFLRLWLVLSLGASTAQFQDLVLREQWCTLSLLLASAGSWEPGEAVVFWSFGGRLIIWDNYSAQFRCVKNFFAKLQNSTLHPCSSYDFLILPPVIIPHTAYPSDFEDWRLECGSSSAESCAAIDDAALQFESYTSDPPETSSPSVSKHINWVTL